MCDHTNTILKPGPFLFGLTRLWNFDKIMDKPAQFQAPTLQAAPESKGLRGDKPQTAQLMTFSKPPHKIPAGLSKHSSLLSWEVPELNAEHSEEAEPSSMDLALWTDSGEEWDALGCAGTQVQSLRGPFWSQNL